MKLAWDTKKGPDNKRSEVMHLSNDDEGTVKYDQRPHCLGLGAFYPKGIQLDKETGHGAVGL